MSEHPVLRIYAEAAEVVAAKAHDYAEDDNVFSNFEFVDDVLGMQGGSFLALIATKVARVKQVLAKGEARNESLRDSLIDLGNYAFLWAAWLDEQTMQNIRGLAGETVKTYEERIANELYGPFGDSPPGLSEL